MDRLPSGSEIMKDEPLSKYTTYRIGGAAKFFAFPQNEEDLSFLASEISRCGLPYFILGNGSNVLAPDAGFPGFIICTRELNAKQLDFLPENEVQVGAGVLNSRLLRASAEAGLTGISFLSGVPGNFGGAVFMNAGTATGWLEERLLGVNGYSLKSGPCIHEKKTLSYSYREQHFLGDNEIIVSARIRLIAADPALIKAELADSLKKRKAAQPIEMPSCGSVFRNPSGHNAWKLISDAGLRGESHGGAKISEKHCNFIVNEGGATEADVLFLIERVKEKVLASSGIRLQEEIVKLQGSYLK